jgi:hypothetical protein
MGKSCLVSLRDTCILACIVKHKSRKVMLVQNSEWCVFHVLFVCCLCALIPNLVYFYFIPLQKTVRELHPDHCNALDHAKLSSKEEKSPTLYYMKQFIDLTYSSKELRKQKDGARNRGVCFCISYSTFWKKPIHLILNFCFRSLRTWNRNTSYNGYESQCRTIVFQTHGWPIPKPTFSEDDRECRISILQHKRRV